jgi:hypothetical protein
MYRCCDSTPVAQPPAAVYPRYPGGPSYRGSILRLDIIELLALALLVATVFVAARTWGQLPVPVSIALFGLALAQALWVLGVIPPLGVFGSRTWAAIACGMLLVLGLAAQGGSKPSAAIAAAVSVAAAAELLVLSGILRL